VDEVSRTPDSGPGTLFDVQTPNENATRLRFLWAKTAAGANPDWHPLVLHLLDVAASADAILALEPESTRLRMARILGLPWPEARPWLLLVIACHDIGKACPPFQQKWPPLLPGTGLRLPRASNTTVHHAFVSQLALADILIQLYGWQEGLADLVADAVGCHHGERASEKAKGVARLAIECGNVGVRQDWRDARSSIVRALSDVFRPTTPPAKPTLNGPDFMLLAGLTSFADWIGSNEEYFRFGEPDACNDLAGWFAKRGDVANQALAAIGWGARTALSSSEQSFEEIFARTPRPLQRAMVEEMRTVEEPAVLLVEAPMGEGKTEAAFFAHLELQRLFGHRGMYVALPSKATGNAMFTRTREFLESRGANRIVDLQLLHGAKLLNDEYRGLQRSRIDDDRPGGGVRAAEWFTHKKRSLLSEYGVGTLDQALLPILPVRHNFVRLWGLANRVVVLDEIHAYDAYTGTLLHHLVSWLQALGSSVVLLSATLAPSMRRSLAEATGSRLPLKEVQYPRLSVFRHNSEVKQRHFEPDGDRRLTVRIRAITTAVSALRAALDEALPTQGMALALVNTVQRAQDLYRQFPDGAPVLRNDVPVGKQLADGTTVLLFHARFPAQERQEREDLVRETFGSDAARRGRYILIATQVAEQSLDLDFDVMVSDLAPIDLILQRAGRLWRHARVSRPVPEPVLFVSGLKGEEPPSFGGPLWWGKVYREDLLLRTWCLLQTHETIALPDDIDPMVTSVYEEHVRIPEFLQARYDKATNAEGEAIAQRSQAHMAIIGLPADASWNDPSRFVLYDEDEPGVHRSLMAQTRLGDSVLAIPIMPEDGFGASDTPDATRARRLFLRSIGISRKPIVRALRQLGVPAGWDRSPLLRTCFALALNDDGRWAEMPSVRLDPALGLIYEAREAE
jgi:CRISPR-associated endonuclease/helicase Cas3